MDSSSSASDSLIGMFAFDSFIHWLVHPFLFENGKFIDTFLIVDWFPFVWC